MKIPPIINNITFTGRYHNDNKLRKVVKEEQNVEPESKEQSKKDLRAMAKQSEEQIQKEREMQKLLSRPQKYRKESK